MTQQMNPGLTHSDLGRAAPQRHVPTDFGEHHHHKPTKAIIGVAIMVVMGFLTYEFRDKAVHPHLSADQATVQQKIASSAH
jgi:hypothetical protein